MEGPLYRDDFVEYCGSVARHFQPSLFVVFFGGIPLYIFRGFYMGSASLKTSPLFGAPFYEEKSAGPFA